MRRRAGEAVEVAAREFARTLDFRPESVEKVEEILGRIHDRHKRSPLSDSGLTRESLRWGAYVGEAIRGVRPGRWALNSKAGGEGSMPVVYADRSESFPVRWCYKRIVNGEEDNVWHKFTILVIERDRPAGLAIGPEEEGGDPAEDANRRPARAGPATAPARPDASPSDRIGSDPSGRVDEAGRPAAEGPE
jgi:hypothetical protein